MTAEELLACLSKIRVYKRQGRAAPHKPLMLLLALGRVRLGPKRRLIPYLTADKRFKELMKQFGPGWQPNTHYPFGRLRNDDHLWEIPEESLLSTKRNQDIDAKEAEQFQITGGFRKNVHDLLCRDPRLVARAAHQILSKHFPLPTHQDILKAVEVTATQLTPSRTDAPPMSQLASTLNDLSEELTAGNFQSQAELSQGLVKRVLHELGWPVFDIGVVTPKLAIDATRVEYALCHPSRRPAVLLEVLDPGHDVERCDGRLLDYCCDHDVPIAVLTDGRLWRLFYPPGQGEDRYRAFVGIDLLHDDAIGCAEVLTAYLAFEDVAAGRAGERAERAQRAAQDQRKATLQFASVWSKLLEVPDPLLLDLFLEEVEGTTGVRPEPSLATTFIRNQAQQEGKSSRQVRPASVMSQGPVPTTTSADSQSQFLLTLHGNTETFASGAELLIAVFRKLSVLDSDFCRRYSATYRGKKRQYVAKTKQALYPGQQVPQFWYAELPNGWWVATHCSNTDKLRRIQQACLIAGVEYGRELVAHMHVGGTGRPSKTKGDSAKRIRVRIGERDAEGNQ